jgi:hypothetical protein
MLYSGNHEPPLDEVLDDPIVRLVMARDRLTREEVRVHIEAARRQLSVMLMTDGCGEVDERQREARCDACSVSGFNFSSIQK